MDLVGARLLLRPLREEDGAAWLRLVQDPEVTRYMDGPLDDATARGVFERILSPEESGYRVWAITTDGDASFCGHAGLIPQGAAAPELLFVIDASLWGQGYGSEAAGLVMAYADQHELPRVVATVDEDHPASIRILEKLGFEVERRVTDEGDAPYRVYSRHLP